MQLLDPSRVSTAAKGKHKTRTTVVVPESVKTKKKKKKKKRKKRKKNVQIINVLNEVGNNDFVSFRVSNKYLQRTFGGGDDTEKKIQEIFNLLSEDTSVVVHPSSGDSGNEERDEEKGDTGEQNEENGENTNGGTSPSRLDEDFAEVEELAVKKRRSKQVLAYLVRKRRRRTIRPYFHPDYMYSSNFSTIFNSFSG